MFPPGRARLCTTPSPTGSGTTTKTIGIVRVWLRSAKTAGAVLASRASGGQADQVCRGGLEERGIPCGKAVVQLDMLPLHPPATRQRLHKGRHIGLRHRVGLGERDQHADTAHPRRLLGAGGAWDQEDANGEQAYDED